MPELDLPLSEASRPGEWRMGMEANGYESRSEHLTFESRSIHVQSI